MKQLSGLDASFLYMETPTHHMHVTGALILDPSTIGTSGIGTSDIGTSGTLPHERLATLFADRMHLIPPFRRRMVAVPGGLDHPRWIEDPDFELDNHLHRRDLGPDATVFHAAPDGADTAPLRMRIGRQRKPSASASISSFRPSDRPSSWARTI